jgi:3-oxoacyl-[acyl-carrier-protein] synthase-3
MNGREVFKFAVVMLQRAIDDALNACDVKADDLAMVIPHQSNIRMIESARQRLGLPEDRIYVNIDRYGNTSAASVAICLHELVEQKRLHEGDLVLFVAIGGGMTWATSLWRL